ncbi:MAG TPA: hypothetical protein VF911_01405 [Thermoanaerobaculia bacterium]|jgi:hypothetical protein
MSTLLAAAFIAVVAVVIYIQRRPLSQMQAMALGGSIGVGCVVAQAIVLLLIAIAFAVAHFSGVS